VTIEKAIAKYTEPPSCLEMVSIDSQRIDDELLGLFKSRIKRVLEPFDADGVERFKPEVDAVLSFMLWWTCIWNQRPTPGMFMLNMRYQGGKCGTNPSRNQRIALGFCTVVAPWFFERVRRRGLSEGWPMEPADSARGRVWKFLKHANIAWKLVYLGNLIAFLCGRRGSPTVPETLSGMQQIPQTSSHRNINFQFMNRDLFFESLTRFPLT
jgi:peroxin-2